jgi:hypothetical protein
MDKVKAMSKHIKVSAEKWKVLRTLGSHYLSCGSSRWYTQDYLEFKPRYWGEEFNRMYPAYTIIAMMLGIARQYLSDSKYPNKDYTLKRTLWFEGLGNVNFTIYPSGGSPNGGLTRFWIECPICKKEMACGRFHQHMVVHKPEGL